MMSWREARARRVVGHSVKAHDRMLSSLLTTVKTKDRFTCSMIGVLPVSDRIINESIQDSTRRVL